MGRYSMNIGPSLSDLMAEKQMRGAQLDAMGQQGQLRNLQMMEARQGMADRGQSRQDEQQLRALLPELMKGGDPQGMIKNLLSSGNPGAIQMAGKLAPILGAMQKETKTTWQDSGDRLIQLDANGQPTGATMPKGAAPQGPEKLPWYVQKGADGTPTGINPLYSDFEKMKARSGAANVQPYYQFLQTPEGYMAGNARTGGIAPVMVGGKPVLAAQSDPTLQGRIAAAKEAGKGESEYRLDTKKAMKKSDQLLTMAKDAERLLKLSPTGSGTGSALDMAGRAIGITSKSAQQAAELETISGWMVSNVPRMEGPQSNFDVQNYQTMAAKIGDRTVPRPERISALKTLVGLQEKYKAINQESIGVGGVAQPVEVQNTPKTNTAQTLPNPATLPNGAIVTDTVSGRRMVVNNGKYQPAR